MRSLQPMNIIDASEHIQSVSSSATELPFFLDDVTSKAGIPSAPNTQLVSSARLPGGFLKPTVRTFDRAAV